VEKKGKKDVMHTDYMEGCHIVSVTNVNKQLLIVDNISGTYERY